MLPALNAQTVVVVAFTLAAANTIVEKTGSRSIEIGANELSVMRHEKDKANAPSATSQWFGGDLGAPEEGKHKTRKQHQVDGFNLDEVRARHENQKSHSQALEEESQSQHHMVRADAGIPILQAAKTKPSERDTWPRDLDDPEPGDSFGAPRDVFNSPGDALLEEAVDKKPSFMRRERGSLAEKSMPDDIDCDKCKDCQYAVPNQPDNTNHSDGVWCMCKTTDQWQTMNTTYGMSDGIYPGAAAACTTGCQAVTNATILGDLTTDQCAQCTCDLNIYWRGPGTGSDERDAAEQAASDGTTGGGGGGTTTG